MSFLQVFQKDPEKFPGFFRRVLESILDENKSNLVEKCAIIRFLNCSFSSLEVELVRKQVQQLVSLHIWHCISDVRKLTWVFLFEIECTHSRRIN